MSPQSASRGPVERGFVFVPAPGTRVARSERRRLMPKLFAKTLVSLWEFQAGSCRYVTAAVKAASNFGRAQGDHSGQSTFEVRWNLSRP